MPEKIEELTFVKEAEMEGNLFYILSNEKGELRVIEAGPYKSFPLSPGTRLKGKMRRKGCAGHEITELLHPFYTAGRDYPFYVKKSASLSYGSSQVFYITVVDPEDNEFVVKLENKKKYLPGEKIICRLIGQNRGSLRFKIVSKDEKKINLV